MKDDSNKESSGGIFGSLAKTFKKIAYDPQYLDEEPPPNEEKEPIKDQKTFVIKSESNNTTQSFVPKPPTSSFSQPPSGQITSQDIEVMTGKLFTHLQSLNKEGTDFLDVWNMAEESTQEFGGDFVQNLRQAFFILNKTEGGKLTIDSLLADAEEYKKNLESVVNDGFSKKEEALNMLLSEKTEEGKTLNQEIEDLEKEIKDKTTLLEQKRTSLNTFDKKYSPKISEINQKITVGKKALGIVLNKINQVVSQVQQIKNK